MKEKKVRRCLEAEISDPDTVDTLLHILKNHGEY